MPTSTCPSDSQVADFVSGRLSEEGIEFVSQHLAECPTCEQRVAELDGQADPLVEAVREMRHDQDSPGSEEFERLLSQTRVPRARQEATTAGSAADTWTEDEEPILGEHWHLGQYELIEELGRGAMGTVYRAMHTRLKRPFAVKVLPPHRGQDKHAVERFHREMEAVGKLHHPNIVTATDAGYDDDRHYLVMEFVQGLDLTDVGRQLGPLPVPEACEIVRQAAVGLHHAHQLGLIHRDVKPSNLMLCQDGDVKVLDLGLALLRDGSSEWHLPIGGANEETPLDGHSESAYTKAGQILGTREYMAPEQTISSHDVDNRADIYSLGCTLYKLLTGTPPFSRQSYPTRKALAAAHAEKPVPPLSQSRPDVPKTLTMIVERMLAKRREARPRSAAEVAAALQVYARDANLSGLLASAKGESHLLVDSSVGQTWESSAVDRQPFADRLRRCSIYMMFGLIAAMVGAATMTLLLGSFRDDSSQPAVAATVEQPPVASPPTPSRAGHPTSPSTTTTMPAATKLSNVSNAIRFDSVDSQLQIHGSAYAIRSTSRFTIETQFRLTDERLGYFLMNNEGTRFPSARPVISPFDVEGWRLEVQGHERQAVVTFTYRDRHMHRAGNRGTIPALGTTWHSLAFSNDGRTAYVWIDGKQVFACNLSRFPSPVMGPPSMNRHDLTFGNALKQMGGMKPAFELSAFKLSQDLLYVGDYDPPLSFERDSKTQSLLDFSQRGRATLPDLSGKNHVGRATAVQWVSLGDELGQGAAR